MSRATEDLLGQLHGLIAEGFIEKFKSGEATSADYNAAIKFLKDNGINCVGTENDQMTEVLKNLPEPQFDDGFLTGFSDPQDVPDVILRTH